MFQKAIKHETRGRIALVGPAGSGKTWTALTIAGLLGSKIAVVDTEKGSAEKYADTFNFNHLQLDSFSPKTFMEAIAGAEAEGHDVFICDSLSHFWMGKEGALEFVDLAAKRWKDGMGGWKEFSPIERQMVDAMTGSKMHVIVTMRTKTEYVEDVNPSTGKKIRKKIGLMPVQRQGLEYEFDLVSYMDDENNFITDKTRCSFYTGKVIPKPKAADFQPFKDWLSGVKRSEPTPAPTTNPIKAETIKPVAQPDPFAGKDKVAKLLVLGRNACNEYRALVKCEPAMIRQQFYPDETNLENAIRNGKAATIFNAMKGSYASRKIPPEKYPQLKKVLQIL